MSSTRRAETRPTCWRTPRAAEHTAFGSITRAVTRARQLASDALALACAHTRHPTQRRGGARYGDDFVTCRVLAFVRSNFVVLHSMSPNNEAEEEAQLCTVVEEPLKCAAADLGVAPAL